jgi:hypothetical protein
MKHRQFLSVFALLLVSTLAHAQGSPYNMLGFGTPVRSGNPVIEALGGNVAAMEGTRAVNDINPADWTWLTRARFDVSLRYEFNNATVGTTQDNQHNFNFSGISFGAPIWSAVNAAVAFGYRPLTNANAQIDYINSVDTIHYISRGGTNMLFFGLAARPIPAIALGARLDLLTGNVRHQDQLTFIDPQLHAGQYERDYLHTGLRPTFGLELIGDSLGLPGLTVGASYSLAADLTASKETIITPSESLLDTTLRTDGHGNFPSALNAGISYHFSRRYRAEADYATQDFSTAYLYSPTTSTGDPNLQASTRMGVGIERLANMNGEFGTSFGLDMWALRLGFTYSTLPVKPIRSGGINELALSAGVGIPFSYESMLNLSAVVGQRLPVNAESAPKETFLRLGASVSISERWFNPTRRD